LSSFSKFFKKYSPKKFQIKERRKPKNPEKNPNFLQRTQRPAFFEKVMKGTPKNGSGNHLRFREGSGGKGRSVSKKSAENPKNVQKRFLKKERETKKTAVSTGFWCRWVTTTDRVGKPK
jgi:hypothetical protein